MEDEYEKEERLEREAKIKEIAGMIKIGGLVLLLVLAFIFKPFVIVDAGRRGVKIDFGRVSDTIFGEGFHFYNPFVSDIYEMNVMVQKEEVEGQAGSADLQTVSFKIAVNYHLSPDFANVIYQSIGREKEVYQKVIVPAVKETVKAAAAKFTASELLTDRARVKDEIDRGLTARLLGYNIMMDDVSIIDLDFSEEFNKAIESKVTAQQRAQQAENDLTRIKIEAQQTIEKAKAEAESIRIQGQALRENAALVDLKYAERWNGVLPTYMMGNAVPFINLK